MRRGIARPTCSPRRWAYPHDLILANEKADLTPNDLEKAYAAFLLEAQRLRPLHPELSLLIGIECDAITPLDASGLSRLLENPVIDYVVGSVHHVRGVSVDFDRPTWLRAVRAAVRGVDETTMARVGGELVLAAGDEDPKLAEGYVPTEEEQRVFLEAYLDAQYDMMRAHEPEVVGHFDLALLWTPEVSLMPVWGKIERNVKFAVGYGALFEANAAALRKGWKTSYPSPDVLKVRLLYGLRRSVDGVKANTQLIMSLGGRVCLSDDSHGVAAVGLNYLPMRDYLVSQGLDTVWYLVPSFSKQEGDEVVGRRGRVVARAAKGWADDDFWVTFKATMA